MKDFEIRNSLHNQFLTHYKNDPDSIVVDELQVCNGNAIVDLAVINGSLIGFEIKSSADNLSRLNNQILFYNKVFDYMTIVTNKNHIDGILKHTPVWWGIWLFEYKKNEIKKTEIRKPKFNTDTDAFSISQFLWKEELIDLLYKKELDIKMKNKRRWILWQYISESICLSELKNEVRGYLKLRQDWKKSQFSISQVNQQF